jgi:hypothetical protein
MSSDISAEAKLFAENTSKAMTIIGKAERRRFVLNHTANLHVAFLKAYGHLPNKVNAEDCKRSAEELADVLGL